MATTTDANTTCEADLSSRIRAAIYGLAVCDALGAPLEFKRRRHNPSEYVTDMLYNSNFDLPPGHFTDDTSMALCLAHSLLSNFNSSSTTTKHDPIDQASRYVRWLDQGYMSSVHGRAFDVGTQTRQALQYWRTKPELSTLAFVKGKFNEDRRCGNGSLMRVLPCALVARTEHEAVDLARCSSSVTHPHSRCLDACAVYNAMVFRALRGATKADLAACLQEYIRAEGFDPDSKLRLEQYSSIQAWRDRPRERISSSGYVLDSLEAALWAFFGTETFERGAVEVVNLGDDADTVGAIYGGLAGAFYGREGVECVPGRWREKMVRMELVDEVVQGIVELTQCGGQ